MKVETKKELLDYINILKYKDSGMWTDTEKFMIKHVNQVLQAVEKKIQSYETPQTKM